MIPKRMVVAMVIKTAISRFFFNLLIYGVGGVVIPFIGIKLIDMLITRVGLA